MLVLPRRGWKAARRSSRAGSQPRRAVKMAMAGFRLQRLAAANFMDLSVPSQKMVYKFCYMLIQVLTLYERKLGP